MTIINLHYPGMIQGVGVGLMRWRILLAAAVEQGWLPMGTLPVSSPRAVATASGSVMTVMKGDPLMKLPVEGAERQPYPDGYERSSCRIDAEDAHALADALRATPPAVTNLAGNVIPMLAVCGQGIDID